MVGKQLKLLVTQFNAAYEALTENEEGFLGKEELLDPYIELVYQLQLSAEYYLAENLTNVEAFNAICGLAGVSPLEIINKLKFPKLKPEEVNILNIHANILGLTIRDVKTKVIELIDRVAPPSLSRTTISTFVDCLARQYRLNPYHNFTHCLSVTQIFYYMWSSSPGIQKVINVDEMYIGCLASLCHDLGHRKVYLRSWQKQQLPCQD